MWLWALLGGCLLILKFKVMDYYQSCQFHEKPRCGISCLHREYRSRGDFSYYTNIDRDTCRQAHTHAHTHPQVFLKVCSMISRTPRVQPSYFSSRQPPDRELKTSTGPFPSSSALIRGGNMNFRGRRLKERSKWGPEILCKYDANWEKAI